MWPNKKGFGSKKILGPRPGARKVSPPENFSVSKFGFFYFEPKDEAQNLGYELLMGSNWKINALVIQIKKNWGHLLQKWPSNFHSVRWIFAISQRLWFSWIFAVILKFKMQMWLCFTKLTFHYIFPNNCICIKKQKRIVL